MRFPLISYVTDSFRRNSIRRTIDPNSYVEILDKDTQNATPPEGMAGRPWLYEKDSRFDPLYSMKAYERDFSRKLDEIMDQLAREGSLTREETKKRLDATATSSPRVIIMHRYVERLPPSPGMHPSEYTYGVMEARSLPWFSK